MTKKLNNCLLIDIGGTNTRIGISFDGINVDKYEVIKTPQDYNEGLNLLVSMGHSLLVNLTPQLISVGIAGPLNKDKTKVTNAPHLPNWNEKPLKKDLENLFSSTVHMENDTALVGLGEAVAGAGKGKNIVTYITVSTGLNGVRIVDGSIDKSAQGFEIGHQIVDVQRLTTLEELLSGSSLENQYDITPEEITDPAVWSLATKYLAICINNTIMYWSPDIVVLGGALMNKIELEKVKKEVEKINSIFPTLPTIVKSTLGEIGGLEGGLHFLRSIKV